MTLNERENLRPGTQLYALYFPDINDADGVIAQFGFSISKDDGDQVMLVDSITICQEPGPMGYTPWAYVKFTEEHRKKFGVSHTYVNLMHTESVVFLDPASMPMR